MKPISVESLCPIISGQHIYGPSIIIRYGAYRLKQVKRPHTALFIEKRIMNWSALAAFFPLVLITEWHYDKRELPIGVSVIQVTNVEASLWQFIRFYRQQFRLPVVAITGTAGKTTTKEMLKTIALGTKNVVATQLSTNSRTAHFQYLLSIDETTDVAIFETAVGAPGDLRTAGKYFQPTIGIITNIGEHHLNYCKTLEGYIRAKQEMLEVVKNGVLIVNMDDANTKKIDFTPFSGKLITVGTQVTNDFYARNIRYTSKGMAFDVIANNQHVPVHVIGYGQHQVLNALAALAAAIQIGITLPEATKQLQSFRPLNKQLQLGKGLNGAFILDDTWSITTTSLAASLDVLQALGKQKKRVAVIGTITDVGSWGTYIHEKAAEMIVKQGVDHLVTVGEHAKIIAQHAKKCGLEQVHAFNNSVCAYELLKQTIDEQTIVLIKGDMYSKTMFELAAKLKKG